MGKCAAPVELPEVTEGDPIQLTTMSINNHRRADRQTDRQTDRQAGEQAA